MIVHVYPDAQTLAKAAAALLAGTVVEKPDAVLGLATGSTPVPTYKELARLNRVARSASPKPAPITWTNTPDWPRTIPRATAAS